MCKSITAARLALSALLLTVCLLAPSAAFAAFGLTSDTTYYTVDTGAGLVFKIRRVDNGVSTQSSGDIASLVYNGVQYQDTSRGSQVNSGFDYLYTGVSAVSVDAAVVNTDFIKVTVVAGDLTHYYLARRGYPAIYMGTYFTTEPDTLNLCRYIVRIPSTVLPNGPTPSDIRNTTSTVESGDIFGLSDGETRSKHYSNMRLIDWSYIGATGTNVGVWMVRDSNEGNSGGPFYRSLLNQCGTDQEITYIVNYGEGQTESPFRTGILNCYTLVFTNGAAPVLPVDTSWFAAMGLTGYVAPAGRGTITGTGLTGRDAHFAYTVGFSNSAAQYWTAASAADGSFSCPNMLPGTYTMTVYKNELGVYTGSATVSAGSVASVGTLAVTGDPSAAIPIWRIGDWDGSPREFLNGDKITTMHPSDVRMSSWTPGTYTVGTSAPAADFPCYQWKDVNGTQVVQFTLAASQVAANTVRIGLTCAFSGARPQIMVNTWKSAIPSPSTQPSSRTLTVGTYRGNNTTYTYSVPASAFLAGTNTLTISPVSGTSGTAFLSPGYSVDCVDLIAPVRSVTGTATLQNWTGTPQPLTFTLTPTNGTAGSVTTQTLTPAANGAYALGNVPAGTYTLGIKGSRWLRKDSAINVTGGNVSGISVSLTPGDLNNENSVSLSDLAIMRAAFNSTPASANWNAAADLNGDNAVTVADLAILRANYSKTGDP